jgi:FAD-dependent urate hydroxylase
LTTRTELLVVGAGPYGLSTAALAREQGIDVVVLGRSMDFWHTNMPQGMFLRSGPDWHLDAAGSHTLEAYMEERRVDPHDADPIPIALFQGYGEWFRAAKGIAVREDLVADLSPLDGGFEATLEGGEWIVAHSVVCAPGIRHYTNLPAWASRVPPGRAAHTCDLVRFEALGGARVLIVGGRQSAYEWAALIREHGAERIDVVHRHDVPRFDQVSWSFVDEHVERTIDVRGYWRNLPKAQRDAIAQRFWEVGRLTLEQWLIPRLDWDGLHRWPGTEVVEARSGGSDGDVEIRLSNSERLAVDYVVFASGYRTDLARVPYLRGVLGQIRRVDGFPVLDAAFRTTLPGFYITGFSATRDFGPFFGFVKGSPAAATLIVRDLASRGEARQPRA